MGMAAPAAGCCRVKSVSFLPTPVFSATFVRSGGCPVKVIEPVSVVATLTTCSVLASNELRSPVASRAAYLPVLQSSRTGSSIGEFGTAPVTRDRIAVDGVSPTPTV